ncbi:MAG: TIR domain-containing protein [Cyanobacteria bacterium J06638_28]
MDTQPVSLFVAYVKADEPTLRELEAQLVSLQLTQLIKGWCSACFEADKLWPQEVKADLDSAQIILLLISPDFMAAKANTQVDLQKAIERHQVREVCVMPVIVRSCLWQRVAIGDVELQGLLILPADAKPISRWRDRTQAFINIAEGICDRIQQWRNPPKSSPSASTSSSVLEAPWDTPVQTVNSDDVSLEALAAAHQQAIEAEVRSQKAQQHQAIEEAEAMLREQEAQRKQKIGANKAAYEAEKAAIQAALETELQALETKRLAQLEEN